MVLPYISPRSAAFCGTTQHTLAQSSLTLHYSTSFWLHGSYGGLLAEGQHC